MADIRLLLKQARVVPVLTLDPGQDAIDLCRALLRGGLTMLEVTLRTEGALRAIEMVARDVPAAMIGVGTITRPEQFVQAANAGARFAVSPGVSPSLIEAAGRAALPYLPGTATPSEVMLARAAGLTTLKFFPAKPMGGAATLAALAPVFGDVAFCPTGGITQQDFRDYLALGNVVAVGGSWMAPRASVAARDWAAIERAAAACMVT
jgi:2-dehydro-3-deoxyphosphogluconate aldolase/(4S)-4-hydroxy-2-oxoglutarate aldolase